MRDTILSIYILRKLRMSKTLLSFAIKQGFQELTKSDSVIEKKLFSSYHKSAWEQNVARECFYLKLMIQADWHKENFLTESQKDNKTKSWNSFIKKCPERQSKQEAKGYWSEKGMSWEKASKDRMAFQNKMNMEMLMSLWLWLPRADSEWHHDLERPYEASMPGHHLIDHNHSSWIIFHF